MKPKPKYKFFQKVIINEEIGDEEGNRTTEMYKGTITGIEWDEYDECYCYRVKIIHGNGLIEYYDEDDIMSNLNDLLSNN